MIFFLNNEWVAGIIVHCCTVVEWKSDFHTKFQLFHYEYFLLDFTLLICNSSYFQTHCKKFVDISNIKIMEILGGNCYMTVFSPSSVFFGRDNTIEI